AHFVALGVMDDDVADLLADLGAARLAGGDNLPAGLLQVTGQAGDLGGLAAAFGTLEGDQLAGGGLGLVGHEGKSGSTKNGWPACATRIRHGSRCRSLLAGDQYAR